MSQSDFEAQPAGKPVIEPSLAVEGFIHLSATAEQVVWVANRWYRDVVDLVVLVIDENGLTRPVRYDSTPDGVFPHLYGPLDRKAIVAIEPLQRSDQGNWIVTAHPSFLSPAGAGIYPAGG